MDEKKSKKEDCPISKPNEYPKVKGNFSWDGFDLDKFFKDFDKVGDIIKEEKKKDAQRFI